MRGWVKMLTGPAENYGCEYEMGQINRGKNTGRNLKFDLNGF
jgi:hypothetical protein